MVTVINKNVSIENKKEISLKEYNGFLGSLNINNIGDQLVVPYTYEGKTYDFVWDYVGVKTVWCIRDKRTVLHTGPLFIAHDASIQKVQFDKNTSNYYTSSIRKWLNTEFIKGFDEEFLSILSSSIGYGDDKLILTNKEYLEIKDYKDISGNPVNQIWSRDESNLRNNDWEIWALDYSMCSRDIFKHYSVIPMFMPKFKLNLTE